MIVSLACLLLTAGPRIEGVKVVSATPPVRFGKIEIAVDLHAKFANPFDPSQVALDAKVVPPSGRTYTVPGFYFQPFRRSVGRLTYPIAYNSATSAKEMTSDDAEVLAPIGSPTWRLRISPMEAGRHKVVVTLRDRQGTSQKVLWLSVGKGIARGFARVKGRYFRLDDGSSFFPIGANVSWAGARGTLDYDAWMPEYAKVGANWGRLWLSPNWVTLALETQTSGVGKFDLSNGWRLDYVLSQAERLGLKLNLCIDSYNILCQPWNWPEWDRTPHNRVNGGPLEKPTDFWTSPEMARLYRNKLRYLVARYGYSTSVFAWEYWNEVDGTSSYKVEPVASWHERMATYLRSIDPYRHLITTSFGGNGSGAGDARIFALKGMDFSQSHIYEAPDLASAVAFSQERLYKLGKPSFVAEIGADTGGSRTEDDPNGMQIHDPLWASIACGAAGGAIPWWWDSYVHPRRLYPIFGAAARFVKGVDWTGMKPVQPLIRYKNPPNPLPREDIVFENGPVAFGATPQNKPVKVDLSKPAPVLSGIYHGIGNHSDLHNPVTFETRFNRPTRFSVEVSNVSGYGGANLRIRLDEKEILAKDFTDSDQKTTDLKEYAGDYAIEIPSGKHTLVVENTGQDWFIGGFRFHDARTVSGPPLLAWATVGENGAVAWIRVRDRTWRRVAAQKATIPPSPASILVLPGLSKGEYRVERWDTYRGVAVSSKALTVSRGNVARIELPPINKDIALKVRRITRS